MHKVNRVLITGASGFIGRAFCAQAAREGWVVTAALRKPGNVSPGTEAFVVGEVDGATDWARALHGLDVIVHLAARAHVQRETAIEPLVEFRRVNTEGTLNLARQAAKAGVRRFVYVSSIGVNGNRTFSTAFTETDIPQPHDFYAISKFEAEQGLTAIARGTSMEVVIVRPPLVYGPGMKGSFASLVKWIRKEIPLPFGGLQNKRSLVALDNLVSFIILCADTEKSPRAADQIFLISDGEDVSTSELIYRVAKAYGVRAHLIRMSPAVMQLGAALLGKRSLADRLLGSLEVNSSKACDLLGWRPVVTMQEQLWKMVHDAACI